MKRQKTTRQFISLLERDKNLKKLVEKNLEMAKKNNPDKITNPAQSLEELYDFLDWSVSCLPWEILKNKEYSSLYSALDQATGYFWYIFDQPLKELEGKGYYFNSLQYLEPIASWIKAYSKAWGRFLSTKQSWKEEYYQMFLKDDRFGLEKGWYEDKKNWHTFNQFFSRRLLNSMQRPISNATVISPADATPQGFYKIDDNNHIINNDLFVKSVKLTSVEDLLLGSKYAKSFAGGTLTHTFLDMNDYHRYHFPIDGTIMEMKKIKGANAGGGVTIWNKKGKRYQYFNEMGFQMIETRDIMVLDNDQFGLVAILPVGMSQVCSCNWERGLKIGKKVNKGEPMGYFLFGGSDIVMIFCKDVIIENLTQKNQDGFQHLLMGQPYCNLKINKNILK